MTTTRVERVSDGEELVFTGAPSHTNNETDPRDRMLTHRRVAIGEKCDASPPRELPSQGSPPPRTVAHG